jgi:hypothetical protein
MASNSNDLDQSCDFIFEGNGSHPAFDGIGDNAIICSDCGAVFCKNCVESTPTPSPSESNHQDEKNSGDNSGENSGGNHGGDSNVSGNNSGDSNVSGNNSGNNTSNCSIIDYLLFTLLQFLSIFSDIPFYL